MFGTCDICGKETDLYSAGGADVCEECLEEHYAYCEHCQECFPKEDTILYYMKDGTVWCEDCAIYAMNFSGLTDDDVDHIVYPEGFDPEEDDE